MLTLIVTIPVKPGCAEAFETLFAQRRARAHAQEPGNLQYDLFRPRELPSPAAGSSGEPLPYTVIERYVDEAAFGEHLRLSTDHVAFMACFAGPPQVTRLQPVAGCA